MNNTIGVAPIIKKINETIYCPICSSFNTYIRKEYKRGEFQLYTCNNCSISFIYPLPDHEDISTYYETSFPLVHEIETLSKEQLIHKDTELIAGFISKFAPQRNDICEVGSGYGALLNGLKLKGYGVQGYDLSYPLVTFCRNELGLDVTQGEMPANSFSQFDVWIGRHFIEHSLNPNQEIQRAMNSLRTKGLLILAVPNFSSTSSMISGRFWQWFAPPAHLFYFNKRSIEYILNENGFEICKMFTRRGDATNLFYQGMLSIYSKIKRRKFAAGFWKQSTKNESSRTLRQTADKLQIISEVITILFTPVSYLINRFGGGEELWCIARKID